ncbi:MAG: DUF5017 domain-containing protein [Mangrovibacterium sp.]
MKNRISVIWGTLLMVVFAGCSTELDLEVPDLKVTTKKTTYSVGEEVKFYLTGDANFVSFYPGVGFYTNALYGQTSTTFAYRYIYRDRTSVENGRPVLVFNNKRSNAAAKEGSLKFLCSKDYNGGGTIEDVNAATWIDLSDKVTWSQNTNNVTSTIDLSEYKQDGMTYFAFKFSGEEVASRYGWDISSLTLRNYVPLAEGSGEETYTIWANASYAPYKQVTQNSETAYWTTGTTLTAKTLPANSPAIDAWLITSVKLKDITADIGLKVKSFGEVVPDFYSYQYWVPGEYEATFVSSNSTVYGKEESVQVIEITITE